MVAGRLGYDPSGLDQHDASSHRHRVDSDPEPLRVLARLHQPGNDLPHPVAVLTKGDAAPLPAVADDRASGTGR